jgi:hypothetical protein
MQMSVYFLHVCRSWNYYELWDISQNSNLTINQLKSVPVQIFTSTRHGGSLGGKYGFIITIKWKWEQGKNGFIITIKWKWEQGKNVTNFMHLTPFFTITMKQVTWVEAERECMTRDPQIIQRWGDRGQVLEETAAGGGAAKHDVKPESETQNYTPLYFSLTVFIVI